MFSTSAILLRSRDAGEADRLFHFYTRDHGKVEARALGIRKSKSKLAGHCLPHAVIRCTFFPGSQSLRLTHAVREAYYPELVKDLRAFAVFSYACEAVDTLIKPGVSDAAIFDLLVRLLTTITKRSASPELLLYAFCSHLFTHLGYQKFPSPPRSSRALFSFLSEKIQHVPESAVFLD